MSTSGFPHPKHVLQMRLLIHFPAIPIEQQRMWWSVAFRLPTGHESESVESESNQCFISRNVLHFSSLIFICDVWLPSIYHDSLNQIFNPSHQYLWDFSHLYTALNQYCAIACSVKIYDGDWATLCEELWPIQCFVTIFVSQVYQQGC